MHSSAVKDLGDVSLKGFNRPIRVYAVEWPATDQTSYMGDTGEVIGPTSVADVAQKWRSLLAPPRAPAASQESGGFCREC